MQTPFRMVCGNFILPEFCKPCLFLYLFQFAQLIVPYPADSGVIRGLVRAVGVADLSGDHTVELIEKLLNAPKAAPGKIDRFHGLRLAPQN